MATVYVCPGCRAELTEKDDLRKEPGEVYAKWSCRQCGTRVPGITAERLRHQ